MKRLPGGGLALLLCAYAVEFALAGVLTGVYFASRAAGMLAWDIVPGIQVFLAGVGAWVNFRITRRKVWAAAAFFLAYMAFSETFELHGTIGRALLNWRNGPIDFITQRFPDLMIHRHPQTISILATSLIWLVLIGGLFRQVRTSRLGFVTFCLAAVIMAAVVSEYLLVCKLGRIGCLTPGRAWGFRQVAELFGTFSLALSFGLVARANRIKLNQRSD